MPQNWKACFCPAVSKQTRPGVDCEPCLLVAPGFQCLGASEDQRRSWQPVAAKDGRSWQWEEGCDSACHCHSPHSQWLLSRSQGRVGQRWSDGGSRVQNPQLKSLEVNPTVPAGRSLRKLLDDGFPGVLAFLKSKDCPSKDITYGYKGYPTHTQIWSDMYIYIDTHYKHVAWTSP